MTPARLVRWATIDELDAPLLYALLRLRVDVFVVEQRCAYPELDGRDLEPGTFHGWVEEDRVPVAYLRLLDEGDVRRIGRVATVEARRGEGLAAILVAGALARTTGAVVLDAQSHLAGWYERFGFRVSGPEHVEDGIPHVPMRLDR